MDSVKFESNSIYALKAKPKNKLDLDPVIIPNMNPKKFIFASSQHIKRNQPQTNNIFYWLDILKRFLKEFVYILLLHCRIIYI